MIIDLTAHEVEVVLVLARAESDSLRSRMAYGQALNRDVDEMRRCVEVLSSAIAKLRDAVTP